MEPDEIDGVVPFGSGIPAMDRADRAAIESVFGDRASDIPLVMPIPYVGNCGAGAGGISIAVAARCIQEQKIPSRINTRGVEGLNANASECEDVPIRAMVVFTTSLGGHNAAVVLRRIQGEG